MRLSIAIFILLLPILSAAQKMNYDSMRKVLQQDSIEYEQQLKDADRIKRETDSILKENIGNTERIGPAPDSAEVIKGLRDVAERELQKQVTESEDRYYLIAGAFGLLLIIGIIIAKRSQFSNMRNKKP